MNAHARESRRPSYSRGASRVVALLLFVSSLLAGCGADVATPEVPRPVLVTHPTHDGSGPSATAFAGDVRARKESPLSFRVGGNLVERRVEVGDHVKRGDLLAVLDARDLQAQARAARAQLA
ncbi:MAG TPA: efflux RND transporter periplasmic adaptor subunit, partial [Lysobacter sp.]